MKSHARRTVSLGAVGVCFVAASLMASTTPVLAQGPSVAVRQIWGSGRDVPGLLGVTVTFRPEGSGVTMSGSWLTGGGRATVWRCHIPPCPPPTYEDYRTRLLEGSVGYSIGLIGRGSNEVYVRPALGVAQFRPRDEGQTFMTFGGDVEASMLLLGLDELRGFVGISGALYVAFKPDDPGTEGRAPSYNEGFSSFGLSFGLMYDMR